MLDFSNDSLNFLEALPSKQYRQVMRKVIELLQKEGILNDRKKLVGYDLYRADVGEYRIIYHTADNNLFIDLIGKLNDDDIYKKLSRK